VLRSAEDAELLHLGLERRPFHAEPGCGTLGPSNDLFSLLESREDMAALNIFQRYLSTRRSLFLQIHFPKRNLQRGLGEINRKPRSSPGERRLSTMVFYS
jgi:hypothetical protein